MDDLSGLDWTAKPTNQPLVIPQSSKPVVLVSPTIAGLSSGPLSRPASAQRSTPKLSETKSPANDSFSNLLTSLPSSTLNTTSNLTLQERQVQLIQERQRQIDNQQKRQQEESQLLDALGGGLPQAAHKINASSQTGHATLSTAHHIVSPTQSRPANGSASQNGNGDRHGQSYDNLLGDDDDTFGLAQLQAPKSSAIRSQNNGIKYGTDDDDILGDLGKSQQSVTKSAIKTSSQNTQSQASTSAFDHAMAELTDMGFPDDRARQALMECNGDSQAAVSWLLTRAHSDAKQKAQSKNESDARGRSTSKHKSPNRSARKLSNNGDSSPNWMRSRSRSQSGQRRRRTSGSATREKDVTQFATEIGSALFKSANVLWKQGQKKVQKAVAEFQHDGDNSQPKWMRDATLGTSPSKANGLVASGRPSTATPTAAQSGVTNEALLLDSGSGRPMSASNVSSSHRPIETPLRQKIPAGPPFGERRSPDPRYQQQRMQNISQLKPKKFDVEAEAAQAYTSSVRRRPTPAAVKEVQAPSLDIFSDHQSPIPQMGTGKASAQDATKIAKPVPQLPKTSRNIPEVSASALQQSATARKKGTEAYKRGDYTSAHENFSAALSHLPRSHPLTIIVLCNRAMTGLKTGQAKDTVVDADRALELIGSRKGVDETINVEDDKGVDSTKSMTEFYAKALMRKAEALENLEKYDQAAQTWRECIAGNIGGAVSAQGRARCERACKASTSTIDEISQSPPVSALRKSPPTITNSAPKSTTKSATKQSEAVTSLRTATAAAERLDDEKFALADTVDARIEAWRGGKTENLRALLASMDTVLWPAAGWKKVSIAELVMDNKVKIVYMRAISKVHPDKVSARSST